MVHRTLPLKQKQLLQVRHLRVSFRHPSWDHFLQFPTLCPTLFQLHEAFRCPRPRPRPRPRPLPFAYSPYLGSFAYASWHLYQDHVMDPQK